jgi:hypothetical protein
MSDQGVYVSESLRATVSGSDFVISDASGAVRLMVALGGEFSLKLGANQNVCVKWQPQWVEPNSDVKFWQDSAIEGRAEAHSARVDAIDYERALEIACNLIAGNNDDANVFKLAYIQQAREERNRQP